jgi:hypothetical protein
MVAAASAERESEVDDHADALAVSMRRCEDAFRELGRAESGRSRLSRLIGRRRPDAKPADEALLALRDLVDRLAIRYRHDIEYVLEHLAEAERRSLVADEIARRVDVLDHSTDGAVVDLARFGAWFAGTDLVLWIGEAGGPLHDAIAGAGPVMVYGGSAPAAERPVGAAVIGGGPVTSDVADDVVAITAVGALVVVALETPPDLTAAVAELEKAGIESTGLVWLADEHRGVLGLLVATFRRSQPR